MRVRSVDWQSLFAYPMSGGFQKWSLMPGALVGPMLALEERVPKAVRRHLAFRMMVVLERFSDAEIASHRRIYRRSGIVPESAAGFGSASN